MCTAPVPTRTSAVMSLLQHGVPLTLLLDLALGPRSQELLAHERPVPVPRPPTG